MHEFQILMYITIFTPNLNCHFADIKGHGDGGGGGGGGGQ